MSHVSVPGEEFYLFSRVDGQLHGKMRRLLSQEEGEGDLGQHAGDLGRLVELHVRSEGTPTRQRLLLIYKWDEVEDSRLLRMGF